MPSVAPRLYSGTTPAGGLSAPLAYAGLGTAREMSGAGGKIAVVDVPYSDGATAPTLESSITYAKAAGAKALVLPMRPRGMPSALRHIASVTKRKRVPSHV